ncbi:BREX-2 system adenine-specific DNA-methyltransferase PglX [Streptosporangium sp. CA-115845]|uniref:BREX-2 system adenine-specific DNA-methyltransferase PglX n=1 Tax=Streptosporangium sp. CA-115845 TaxID=3240071 RepID=UPI003D8C6839
MIDRKALLADLQKQVRTLEKDLRDQVETASEIVRTDGTGHPGSGADHRGADHGGAVGGGARHVGGGSDGGRTARKVRDRLDAEYRLAFRLGRTAATWAAWRDERVTQAAAAWVLGTVFVRFCEDNGLLTAPYLAGPAPERMVLAEEAQEEFFRVNPAETDRGWLLAAFAEIAGSQAGALLFDRRHNPLYQIPISHDAAKELIGFWRRRGEDGVLVHSLASEDWDTRFLGDLYQDLSEAARKTYALLQTPEFVEEFILDYTLTPAIAEFGHDGLRMIDPTCGSGHFVLGAFHRLLDEWTRRAPMRDRRELVRLALTSVHGVDLNPFAIAVARFRLLIAALRASGFTTLAEARNYEFPLNLAIGDSLIKARQLALPTMESDAAILHGVSEQGRLFAAANEQGDLFSQTYEEEAADLPRDELAGFAYATEDVQNFPGILRPGSYHVVVGNPPYITVKDKKLNELYRELYKACAGQYALSVPFAQRFFELAMSAENDGRGAGYTGQITANSFMKREFGRKLIEEFFAHQVELTHVIDTSGAYIPGHGTPTVILFGRSRRRKRSETIHMVMGISGEPGPPPIPAEGRVWQAIITQIGNPKSESKWLSTTDTNRKDLARYPWNLGGGGAVELQELIESAGRRKISDVATSVGRSTATGEDELYFLRDEATARRLGESDYVRDLVVGDTVRDFVIFDVVKVRNPYLDSANRISIPASHPLSTRSLWPARTLLARRVIFGKSMHDQGRPWTSHLENYSSKLTTPHGITFAFVSTHNHFIFDRLGRLFNRTAPVIKLPTKASDAEHFELLGVLNSSTACFWLKQVSQSKGNGGIGGGISDEPWEHRYEFTGTKLNDFPIPTKLPLESGRKLDALAQRLSSVKPSSTAAEDAPSRERLKLAQAAWHSTRAQMIASQEELDWEVYSLYGLLDDEMTAPAEVVPELKLGERAFEIVLARKVARGEAETQWFVRHGSTPITELPEHWSAEYKAVVEKRIALIETDRNIGLIERPECKRRWATEGWDSLQAKALRNWLLDRCEARELWFHYLDGMEQPRMLSTAQLADLLRPDEDFVSVAELYAPGKDLEKVVAELVADEHVPYLSQLRYKDSGLGKRADWEDVWDRQRREDAAQAVADAARQAAEEQRKVIDEIEKAERERTADEGAGELAEREAGGAASEAERERAAATNMAEQEQAINTAEREQAAAEWARLKAEQARAEAEVKRIRDAIPVPPKYGSGDFLKVSYWRNRGKLDVPKERFISYPHAGRDGDPALLLGWAGWDHKEQAQALATVIVDREQNHGWDADRLTPLLAGLREILPWVRQWHDEFDYVYGAGPADIYEGFLTQTRDRLHLGDDDLTTWRPPKTTRPRKQP